MDLTFLKPNKLNIVVTLALLVLSYISFQPCVPFNANYPDATNESIAAAMGSCNGGYLGQGGPLSIWVFEGQYTTSADGTITGGGGGTINAVNLLIDAILSYLVACAILVVLKKIDSKPANKK